MKQQPLQQSEFPGHIFVVRFGNNTSQLATVIQNVTVTLDCRTGHQLRALHLHARIRKASIVCFYNTYQFNFRDHCATAPCHAGTSTMHMPFVSLDS
jgi:hypothetical protein